MIVKKLKNSVELANKDFKFFGKSYALRHGLGAEKCIQWRVMSHLEQLLPNNYKLIPETYLVSGSSHDLGVFTDLSFPLSPVMLVEFKFTKYNRLFQCTKIEVKKDFTKLIRTMRFIEKQKVTVLPFFGLVFYLEDESKILSKYRFMAQKADETLFNSSTALLNNYFEIIIREVEGDILFKPPLKNN